MKIKMGPILSFRGNENNAWNVSVMIVTDILAEVPSVSAQVGAPKAKTQKITGNLLKAFPKTVPNSQAWRFDLSVKQSSAAQKVTYTIGDTERSFWVPPRGAAPNMIYATCNGFSSLKLLKNTKDPNRLWRAIAKKHAAEPYHILMMGGDQLYSDSIWEQVPELKEWASLPLTERVTRPFTQTMQVSVDEFYGTLYVERWSQPEPADVFAQVPTIMMWDDHDIIDGWGSYPDNLQNCDVFKGIFNSAREYFALYQLQLGERESHPLKIQGQEFFSLGGQIGPLVILALDMRSERTASQVLSLKSWKGIYDWLDEIAVSKERARSATRHLFVMSSIPVVHPDFSTLEKLLGIFPGQQELEDDLRDHWMSNPHRQERLRLIHRLLTFSQTKKCRVTLLSGDVHVGAVGIIKSKRAVAEDPNSLVINQLTSSGIVHPAPPGMVLYYLENISGKKLENDRDIYCEMIEFPGTRHCFIGARNWLALEPDASERIWANWHVENEPDPFTKVIHPINFEMPPAIVPPQ